MTDEPQDVNQQPQGDQQQSQGDTQGDAQQGDDNTADESGGEAPVPATAEERLQAIEDYLKALKPKLDEHGIRV